MIVLLRLQHLLPRGVEFHYCSPAENEFHDRADRVRLQRGTWRQDYPPSHQPRQEPPREQSVSGF